MSKEQKQKFIELTQEYHKCLNQFYFDFFDGKKVDFANACNDKLEEIKKIDGGIYEKYHKEYMNYEKEAQKKNK
jgi:hypothetical protein